jgi:hypothetical protein
MEFLDYPVYALEASTNLARSVILSTGAWMRNPAMESVFEANNVTI